MDTVYFNLVYMFQVSSFPKGQAYGAGKFQKYSRGVVALLLTVIILSVIFVIATGIAVVRLIEMKLAFNVSESAIAYQAADSGMEYALYKIKGSGGDPTGLTIINDSSPRICDSMLELIPGSPQYGKYCIKLVCGTGTCGVDNVTEVTAIGASLKTKRAIGVSL